MAVQRIQMNICMEFGGTQYPMDKIRAAIKDRVVTQFPDCKVKKIGVYIQPETNFIYYTVNGEGSPEQCISFDEIQL